MAIAKKAFIWGIFAAGGTMAAFVFPALITLFLLISLGKAPDGLQFQKIHAFASSGLGMMVLFVVLFLSIWHAAHRLRVVAHDFGIRKDALVASVVYTIAAIASLLVVYYLVGIA